MSLPLPAGTELPGDSTVSTVFRNDRSFTTRRLIEALQDPRRAIGAALTAITNPAALVNGGETMNQFDVGSAAVPMTSGTLRLAYYTAQKTETKNNISIPSGATAAAGLTLARLGLYSVDPVTGALVLLGATANDPTLFAAANTEYTRALTSPVPLVAGTRYALGVLVVGTTPPSLNGIVFPAGMAAALAAPPKIAALVSGQPDLPASLTDAQAVSTTSQAYARLLP